MSIKPLHPYSLSLTAASLRAEMMRLQAALYLETEDWERVKREVLSTNAFQCRTTGSLIRLERELRTRIQHLTLPQIRLLADSTWEARTAMAWLAACKHMEFVRAFATDVLRGKLEIHDPVLRLSDYRAYVEDQAAIHPALERLTPASREKIRQRLLFMLGEAGLLIKGEGLGRISRPAMPPSVMAAIREDHPRWLACFLVPDSEISRL
ncbi:MAG: DUF1819 family protein [Verrucomicrobiaceae bacterium]|nr:MAG: DUF1819 family protein [Verrucomicrobiaceae bacterium]